MCHGYGSYLDSHKAGQIRQVCRGSWGGVFSSRECFLAFGLGILALGFGVVVMYLAPWENSALCHGCFSLSELTHCAAIYTTTRA